MLITAIAMRNPIGYAEVQYFKCLHYVFIRLYFYELLVEAVEQIGVLNKLFLLSYVQLAVIFIFDKAFILLFVNFICYCIYIHVLELT